MFLVDTIGKKSQGYNATKLCKLLSHVKLSFCAALKT